MIAGARPLDSRRDLCIRPIILQTSTPPRPGGGRADKRRHPIPIPACSDLRRAYICIMTQLNTRRPRSPKTAAAHRRPIDQFLSADLFKALSDPTRLRLLACLAKCSRPCSVTEIAECCSVDFSVVSRHLALLERAQVLDASKKGRVVSYSVRYAHLAGMLRSLADAFDQCCPSGVACDPKKGGCCDAG